MGDTLKKISDMYAKKQQHQVDNLTKDAPILALTPFEPATHAMWHVIEKFSDVTGAGFVDMNSPLPTLKAESNISQINLQVMGGEMECPQDTARAFGGEAKYFANQTPIILRKSGMSAEYELLYNTLRKYAIANGNVMQPTGATGDANYTILCVRFIPGEVTGLYSPDGFKNGAMLEAGAINGGEWYKNSSGVLVKGMYLKNYFGFMAVNPDAVSAILNISTTKLPTSAQIDETILNAEANGSNSFLFSHPMAKAMVANKLKTDKLQVMPSDGNMKTSLTYWDDIPWITSYNFLKGTEALVTIS